MDITAHIRAVNDFPREGVVFRDMTPLFANPVAFSYVISELMKLCDGKNIELVAGIEARGFILAGALAHAIGAGLVPIRKQGKLPWKTRERSYDLEYGSASMAIHEDALSAGQTLLLVDDLIATGGTANCAVHLLRGLGAEIVSFAAIVDLPSLGGSARLHKDGIRVDSLCSY